MKKFVHDIKDMAFNGAIIFAGGAAVVDPAGHATGAQGGTVVIEFIAMFEVNGQRGVVCFFEVFAHDAHHFLLAVEDDAGAGEALEEFERDREIKDRLTRYAGGGEECGHRECAGGFRSGIVVDKFDGDMLERSARGDLMEGPDGF